MIFHASISADDPERVAGAIAELWGGKAAPFHAVVEGAWAARAGDARGSMVEVYPRGTRLMPADGDRDSFGAPGAADRMVPFHMAIASPLDRNGVETIARREGWISKYRKRGGAFGVIEFWLENCLMLEVLTPEMQAEYLQAMGRPSMYEPAL
jgi:hypothetical protein